MGECSGFAYASVGLRVVLHTVNKKKPEAQNSVLIGPHCPCFFEILGFFCSGGGDLSVFEGGLLSMTPARWVACL